MDKNLNQPLVSVNIATYNRGGFLAEAIESVLAQTYTNWELVIVDDASTDNTREVVDSYLKDPRIKYFRNETNLNISLTRNRGLKESQGEFIAVLDSDDIWCDKDKLKKQVEFLENNPDHALVGTGVIKIDKNGREMSRYLNPLTDKTIRVKILSQNAFAHSSLMYRREAVLALGGYDPAINGIEDYDLWLKIGSRWQFANLPDYALKYRVHGSNISLTDRKRLMRINIDLIKKNKRIYPRYRLALLRRLLRLWAYQVLSALSILS